MISRTVKFKKRIVKTETRLDACITSNALLSMVVSEIENHLVAYESAFKVTAELNDNYDEVNYFMVTIEQEALPEPYDKSYISVMVEYGKYRMEISEDSWCDVNTENLFVYMYFDIAPELRDR